MFHEESIPLEVATRFFAELTKRAEWTEPPDMTGQLEGQFAAPVEQVLAKLKEVITAKLRKMVAYYTYAQSFNHHSWRAIKTEFGEHAEDEQCGAEFYMKRATVLGGPILIDAIEPPPPTTNPHTILMTMARAEQEGIFAQRALRQLVGDDNPMKVGIEEHMLKDQHHLDELFQMMAPEDRLALEQGGAAAMEPPAPEAAPDQGEAPPEEKPKEKTTDEKVAAMRLALAKTAMTPAELAMLGALPVGYYSGKNIAGETAAALAPEGRVTRSDNIARQAAMVGAPAGMLAGGVLAAHHHGKILNKLPSLAKTPFAPFVPAAAVVGGGMAGGLGAGALTGAVQQLRGPARQKKEKTAAEKSDAELKETGRQRAVTNLSAEAHREKGRRGERFGNAIGSLGGAVGGGALGRALVGGPAGTLGGAALGGIAGGRFGRELGSEVDIAKNAGVKEAVSPKWIRDRVSSGVARASKERGEDFAAKMTHLRDMPASGLHGKHWLNVDQAAEDAVDALRKKAGALEKLHPGTKGYHGPIVQKALETGPRTIIDPEKVAAMRFRKAAAELGMGGEEMSTPTAGELEPANYLRAEMAGRQAQEQNESAFYRQRLGEAQAAQQQMQSQVQNSQMQMQSLQQTADQANVQIEQAMQQATMAQDQATQQALEAARARMGAQQLRAQILQIASQDPSTFGDPAMGLSPMGPAGGMGPSAPADPNAPADPGADPGTGPGGPAAASPDQQQAGAAGPGGTGEGQNTTGNPGPGAEGASPTTQAGQTPNPTTVNIKTSSAGLAAGLGAAVGGLLGAGKSLLSGPQAGALRGRAQSLEGAQDGSFRAAAELAAARGQAESAELAAAHPQRSALSGGLRGAMLGAVAGPAIFAGGRELFNNVRELVR